MITIIRASSDGEHALALAVRQEVFVEEQGVPIELEIDETPEQAMVFLAMSESGQVTATGRYRPYGPLVKFERIATRKAYRRQGIGRKLMVEMTAHAEANYPQLLPYMHAQYAAVPFYLDLGWREIGPEFEEAGIRHVTMILEPTPVQRATLEAAKDLPASLRSLLLT